MLTGKVHSIQTMGTLDGPGIRYVLFVQGCPFRCLFCHNPDTWNILGNNREKIDNPLRYGVSNEKSVDYLVEDVLKYKKFYDSSNGGVTVSGGEPLLQIPFLTEFFKTLKQNDIHTAIDTCGYVDISDKLDELIKYTDLFLLDIKHLNPDKHKELTGRENDKVLKFLEHINSMNKKIWIRQVLVPDWTMSEEYINGLIEFLKNYNIEKVELLPYHEMGKEKYEKLGISYRLKTRIPSKEEVEKIKNKFIKNGFDAV